MFHSFQMQKAVDKEFFDSKLHFSRQIDENFPGIFRERETQHVGDLVLAPILEIELVRERGAAENERKFILFS